MWSATVLCNFTSFPNRNSGRKWAKACLSTHAYVCFDAAINFTVIRTFIDKGGKSVLQTVNISCRITERVAYSLLKTTFHGFDSDISCMHCRLSNLFLRGYDTDANVIIFFLYSLLLCNAAVRDSSFSPFHSPSS